MISTIMRAAVRRRYGLDADAPSFAERDDDQRSALYIIGSPDLARQHHEHRRDRGHANFANALLVEVAEIIDLRFESSRREDGEVELRAGLVSLIRLAESWIEAIDRRAE